MLDRAKRVFEIEADSILRLRERLDENFMKAVNLLLACTGKVIVTGIGKSGIIGRKIASTFACSGTPAFFLHPAEGMHGDIGMIAKSDVVVYTATPPFTFLLLVSLIHKAPSIRRTSRLTANR